MRGSVLFLLCSVICGGNASLPAVSGPPPVNREAQQVLIDARAKAVEIPAQAAALVDLAWPVDGSGDPDVQQLARQELVGFGKHGLRAMRDRMKVVAPEYQADIVTAIIEAQRTARGDNSPDFLPALEEGIWFGSIEAQRVAMIEIANYPFPPAILSTIDAIHLRPELTIAGLQTLGNMGDARGRFFLRRVLVGGEPRYKSVAAKSLGMLGDQGVTVLRYEVRSQTQQTREAAMSVLLEFTTTDDLTMLYDYYGTHESDNPHLLDQIAKRAELLEQELMVMQEAAAASADPTEEAPVEGEAP